jgi:hypothetical protein
MYGTARLLLSLTGPWSFTLRFDFHTGSLCILYGFLVKSQPAIACYGSDCIIFRFRDTQHIIEMTTLATSHELDPSRAASALPRCMYCNFGASDNIPLRCQDPTVVAHTYREQGHRGLTVRLRRAAALRKSLVPGGYYESTTLETLPSRAQNSLGKLNWLWLEQHPDHSISWASCTIVNT